MGFLDILNFLKKIFLKKHEEAIFRSGIAAINTSRLSYDSFLNLHEADLKVFSQYGEDGILDFLLYKLKIYKPSFIEIGTGDYSESNTRFVYQKTNCIGTIIDCDKFLQKKVIDLLGDYYWKGNLKVYSKFITRSNIEESFNFSSEKNKIDEDIFSLDIDGNDYWILNKLIKRIESKIIILEYNPYFGSDYALTVPYIENFNRTKYHYSNLCWGASLKSFFILLQKHNYVYAGSNLNNSNGFWIKEEYSKQLKIHLPKISELNNYVNCNCRESRNKDGKMNYLSEDKRLNEIKNCKVINLENSETESLFIKDIFKIN